MLDVLPQFRGDVKNAPVLRTSQPSPSRRRAHDRAQQILADARARREAAAQREATAREEAQPRQREEQARDQHGRGRGFEH